MVRLINEAITRFRLFRRFSPAQTMTEYALILAAVGIVAFAAYGALGTSLTAELNNITADL